MTKRQKQPMGCDAYLAQIEKWKYPGGQMSGIFFFGGGKSARDGPGAMSQ